MRLWSLGSGSSGNCLVCETSSGQLLLIDCGFSAREIVRRTQLLGLDLARFAGILFTHDHVDHYSGVAALHKKYPSIILWANGDTAVSIAAKTGVKDGWSLFETSVPFSILNLKVTPFTISHDAVDPVGFLLVDQDQPASRLFIGTDTGYVTQGMRVAFSSATCAVLESNHDPILLEQSQRPVSLKQRIRGRSGHLANADAALLVRETNPVSLKTLLLAHLSRACNSYPLAEGEMRSTLEALGRQDITLKILSDTVMNDVFEF